MQYPLEVFVMSSWLELEDGLSKIVVGVAYSEESMRRASETYARMRATDDLADDLDGDLTALVWGERNVDGVTALYYGDSGLAICEYQPIGAFPEEMVLTEAELNRAG